jgi:hypothetical protein
LRGVYAVFEETIALAVFGLLALLVLLGRAGWLPRGAWELLGEEEEGAGPAW